MASISRYLLLFLMLKMTDIAVSIPLIIDKNLSFYDIILKKMPLMVHCMRGEEETARIRRTKEKNYAV